MDALERDEKRLQELGYKQELKRDWGLLHNFGISFSIISVITGITTLFEYGLVTGGPGVMSVGWIVVSFFTMFIALSMAEVVSAIPTSGGNQPFDIPIVAKYVLIFCRALLLGRNARAGATCSICQLDYRVVQPFGSSRSHYGHLIWTGGPHIYYCHSQECRLCSNAWEDNWHLCCHLNISWAHQ